jgi:hypothetical protein
MRKSIWKVFLFKEKLTARDGLPEASTVTNVEFTIASKVALTIPGKSATSGKSWTQTSGISSFSIYYPTKCDI